MDRLDALLCEFQVLEMVHINFGKPLKNCSLDSIIQQLPRWQKKIASQGLPTFYGPSTTLSHDTSRPCCAETKNCRGTRVHIVIVRVFDQNF